MFVTGTVDDDCAPTGDDVFALRDRSGGGVAADFDDLAAFAKANEFSGVEFGFVDGGADGEAHLAVGGEDFRIDAVGAGFQEGAVDAGWSGEGLEFFGEYGEFVAGCFEHGDEFGVLGFELGEAVAEVVGVEGGAGGGDASSGGVALLLGLAAHGYLV